jgi:hypothetical protein
MRVLRARSIINYFRLKTDGERVYRVTDKPDAGAEASTSAPPRAA